MKKIKLICYDFDGVMTDNKVFFDQEGREMVKVNRSDGLGVSEIKQLGLKQIIISIFTHLKFNRNVMIIIKKYFYTKIF